MMMMTMRMMKMALMTMTILMTMKLVKLILGKVCFTFYRGFINVFRSRVTGFHRQAKLFELNFFITKINLPPDC